MSSVAWYFHRLRAMSPAELGAHGRRKIHQLSDRFSGPRRFTAVRELPPGSVFPQLPPAELAPENFRAALRRDVADILRGRWIAFGYLPLRVEDPPRWHMDYLAGVDMATSKPALKLHHRLEGKADIKLIWEPNRWYSLVRLAQAAYVLGDMAAAAKCLDWLEDWVEKNTPYYGWNWTSALETGLRLIQFVWIDALLTATCNADTSVSASQTEARATGGRLARIRAGFLLPHLWFTWRDRSFGSSANNHLLGELAGLIVALVRWPALTRWAAPLDRVQRAWEREILTQFAVDGGNREQALNYHLFGFEFCWQARLALRAAGRKVSPEADERLRAAGAFFTSVQSAEAPWDYGDSDSAYVTPFFTDWERAMAEWHAWLKEPAASPAISYWIGDPPKALTPPTLAAGPPGARIFTDTGLAIWRAGDWFLRWDLSPLGYLSTAGHGHCDALHLSIWFKGRAVVIDPGTGAYHCDRPLRDYLASWEAHNGPHPVPASFPERKGAFLWSARHERPQWERGGDDSMMGRLQLPNCVVSRTLRQLKHEDGWQIEDAVSAGTAAGSAPVQVQWQFAPDVQLLNVSGSAAELHVGGARLRLEFGKGWTSVQAWTPGAKRPAGAHPLSGWCAPAFRRKLESPFILLRGEAGGQAPLRTMICAAPG